MGANSVPAPPINVIHCPLVDKMVCEVAAINATRSGYKYGNEENRYRGKEKRLFQVGGAVGENIM
jgi:hypothetical protein